MKLDKRVKIRFYDRESIVSHPLLSEGTHRDGCLLFIPVFIIYLTQLTYSHITTYTTIHCVLTFGFDAFGCKYKFTLVFVSLLFCFYSVVTNVTVLSRERFRHKLVVTFI